jgi:hypothetical protein
MKNRIMLVRGNGDVNYALEARYNRLGFVTVRVSRLSPHDGADFGILPDAVYRAAFWASGEEVFRAQTKALYATLVNANLSDSSTPVEELVGIMNIELDNYELAKEQL